MSDLQIESPLKTVLYDSLEHRVLHSFDLTVGDIMHLEKAYLLHWSGDYFRSLYDHSPVFLHQGTKYQILFYKGEVKDILTSKKVLVSFRKLSPKYPYGYAMVKSADGKLS